MTISIKSVQESTGAPVDSKSSGANTSGNPVFSDMFAAMLGSYAAPTQASLVDAGKDKLATKPSGAKVSGTLGSTIALASEGIKSGAKAGLQVVPKDGPQIFSKDGSQIVPKGGSQIVSQVGLKAKLQVVSPTGDSVSIAQNTPTTQNVNQSSWLKVSAATMKVPSPSSEFSASEPTGHQRGKLTTALTNTPSLLGMELSGGQSDTSSTHGRSGGPSQVHSTKPNATPSHSSALDVNAQLLGIGTGMNTVAIPARETDVATVGTAQLDVRDPNALAKFGQLISVQANQGQTQLHVQIIPEGMGQLDVTVTKGSDGLQIQVMANQASTFTWLNQTLPNLQQTMQDAGFQVAGMQLSFNQNSHQGSEQRQEKQSSSRRTVAVQGVSGPAVDSLVSSSASKDGAAHAGNISLSV